MTIIKFRLPARLPADSTIAPVACVLTHLLVRSTDRTWERPPLPVDARSFRFQKHPLQILYEERDP